jgi:hypothetical protein
LILDPARTFFYTAPRNPQNIGESHIVLVLNN